MNMKIFGAALAVLVIALAVFAVWQISSNDLEFRVVASDSMEPAIHKGDVILISGASLSSLKVGDIIAFGQGKVYNTSRIIEVLPEGFRTKGDADNNANIVIANRQDVLGKVLFAVPYMGHIGSFVRTPMGFALMILIPAVLIIFYEALKIKREIDKERKSRKKEEEIYYLGYKEHKHHAPEEEKHAKFTHLKENLEEEASVHAQDERKEESEERNGN
jgi:signal peptidase